MTIACLQKHRGNRHHKHVSSGVCQGSSLSFDVCRVSFDSGRVTAIPMICANLVVLRAGEWSPGLFAELNKSVNYCIN